MVDIFLEICSIENRCVGQSGSALRSGRRGRWFESSHPDFFKKLSVLLGAFFMGLMPHKSPMTEVYAAAVPPWCWSGCQVFGLRCSLPSDFCTLRRLSVDRVSM